MGLVLEMTITERRFTRLPMRAAALRAWNLLQRKRPRPHRLFGGAGLMKKT
jgi:hypothetical protein